MIWDDDAGFGNLRGVVDRAIETLRDHTHRFDSIMVTGVSGMSVGFPVALALDKPIIVLRKPREATHGVSGELINWWARGERVLFLDDFCESGETLKRCRDKLTGFAYDVDGRYSRLVGAYLYRDDQLTFDAAVLTDDGGTIALRMPVMS